MVQVREYGMVSISPCLIESLDSIKVMFHSHSDYKMVITDFPSISEDDLVLIRVDLLASHILRMSCEHVDSQFGIQQVVSFG